MRENIIVKRYAQAFIAYADETIGTEKAVKEFKGLKKMISDNPQISSFLNSPQILNREKEELIGAIFKENFSQELKQFLNLLIEKKRIDLLVDIADYIRINYSHGEAIDAVLRSAYFLDLDLISQIKQKLELKLGKKFNFYLELDASLLGGVQVVIGNKIIDGTLRKRLDDLKEKLKQGAVA